VPYANTMHKEAFKSIKEEEKVNARDPFGINKEDLMIFFGHTGITAAIINKFEKSAGRDKKFSIDYRYVLIGSVLPDIIDKPLEMIVNHAFPPHGRMYAHTLLFAAILMIIGMIYNFKYKNVFIFGVCSFIHVLIDGMWMDPKVFLFPLFGFNLSGPNVYNHELVMSSIFQSYAYLIIGELLGIYLLYRFAKEMLSIKQSSFKDFFKKDAFKTNIKRLITKPIYSSEAAQEAEQANNIDCG